MTARIIQNHRYEGSVDVPFPMSLGASNSVVKSKLEGLGFSNVEVVDSRPTGWAGPKADYYARATWPKPDQDFEVPPMINYWNDLGPAAGSGAVFGPPSPPLAPPSPGGGGHGIAPPASGQAVIVGVIALVGAAYLFSQKPRRQRAA